jgi:hypothetical protein
MHRVVRPLPPAAIPAVSVDAPSRTIRAYG